MKSSKAAAALLIPLALAACSGGKSSRYSSHRNVDPVYGAFKVGDEYTVNGETYQPVMDYSYNETGMASWYGPGFHGNNTANGARFNTDTMTAAHKTLPMPCYVRVTNLDNGRSVEVMVNDRGPFVEGRIIDVSKNAAQKLGMIGTGTARVRVEFLKDESEKLWAQLGVLPEARRYAKGDISRYNETQVASNPPPQPTPTYRGDETSSVVVAARSPSSYQNINQVVASNLETLSTNEQFTDQASKVESVEIAEPKPAEAPIPKKSIGGIIAENLNPVPPAMADEPQKIKLASLPAVAEVSAATGGKKYIQAGAFSVESNAFNAATKLSDYGPTNVEPVLVSDRKIYRLRVGPFASEGEARKALDGVKSAGLSDARIVN